MTLENPKIDNFHVNNEMLRYHSNNIKEQKQSFLQTDVLECLQQKSIRKPLIFSGP